LSAIGSASVNTGGTERDPLADLHSELPVASETKPNETAGTPKGPRGCFRGRRRPTKRPEWPRWYANPKSQAIAEFLAFNHWIDQMLGRELDLTSWPYNAYRPEKVGAFLSRLSFADRAEAAAAA